MILSEIARNSCQILCIKCTRFNFGWGSAPDPAGRAHSAPSDPLAGFRGREGKGKWKGQGRKWKEKGTGRGEGREAIGKEREGEG